MFSFVKRLKSRKLGLPYHDPKFWPPFYISFGGVAPLEAEVLTELYDANIGDVVPVFVVEGIKHLYRLNGISRAAGGDHIVSNLQFDITYDSSTGGNQKERANDCK